MTTKCLVADDQAMVREGFGALLAAQTDMAVVGQAANGADAVRLCRDLDPDVVLMDIRMPVMDGLDATRQILSRQPEEEEPAPRVLVLTTFDLDEYVYEALRAGASGFLLKDAPGDELVHAVRVIAAGDALLAPSVTRRLFADFRPPSTRRRASGLGRRADGARERDPAPDRPRPVEHGDQPDPVHRRTDDQNPRRANPVEVGAARPGTGSCVRLRVRSRQSRRLTTGRTSVRGLF